MKYQIQELSTKSLNNLFSQIEALNGIYLDLGFKKSLPLTRGWAASPDFLYQIAGHALSEKPQTIVECGSGVSTLILARSVQINGTGHVYSLEHLPEYAQRTRNTLNKHGIAECATVIDAPLRTVQLNGKDWRWYSVDNLPDIGIDMLVIDGPPESTSKLARYPVGPILFNRVKNRGTVFLDDASRPDEREIIKLWMQENPALHQEVRDCEKGCVILYKDKKNKPQ